MARSTKGNQYARKSRNGSLVVRVETRTVGLIEEVLQLEGIAEPSREDVLEAAKMELHMAFERRKAKALRRQDERSDL